VRAALGVDAGDRIEFGEVEQGQLASGADFADCLIERCEQAAECKHTVTFDRNAATGAGMRLPG
jgi:predicted nucleic-acid-binding protein